MRRGNGFTLIELLIALVVAAIALTVAVPSFTAVIRDNRQATQANELVTALMYARSEASKRQATVRVCAEGAACDGSAKGGDWDDGWFVYAVDADEMLQEWSGPGTDGMTLNATPAASAIEYAGDGTVDDRRTLVLCDARGAGSARAVNIAATGRAELARREGGAGDEIVDDYHGNDVTCP